MKNNPLLNAMNKSQNRTARTANGAVSNHSSLDDCVDLFGKIAAMRNNSDATVISQFTKAFAQDPLKALKILFWNRDVRGGAGERKTSRTIFKYLAEAHTDVMAKNIHLVAEFGRWDDLMVFLDTPLKSQAMKLITNQFKHDYKIFVGETKGNPSLLFKWLPSENASSKLTKKYARIVRDSLGISSKKYRKALSVGRKFLNVIERDLCSKNYDNIDYSKVPSRAAMVYRKAFGRNDEKRYQNFLGKVEKGEAEIKTATLYPYDIARPILNGVGADGWGRTSRTFYDKTLILQWENLPNYVEPFNGMVICDTSGSMYGSYYSNKNNDVRPIDVAISLTMYIAERNVGVWKNSFFTFNSNSQLQSIKGSNIIERMANLSKADWGGSTNFQSTFDKILETAKRNNLTDDELPKKVFCVSDMQFNNAGYNTNFEVIRRKYETAGYTMPQLVFWNVNASSDSPVTIHDSGTALISGCSPAILKSVLSGEIITPVDVMNQTIESERYSVVTV